MCLKLNVCWNYCITCDKLSNMSRISQPVCISVAIIAYDCETLCSLQLGQMTDIAASQILMVTEETVYYLHRNHAVYLSFRVL